MSAMAQDALIRDDGLLPERVRQLIRKMKLDKATGFVQLNISEGRVVNVQHLQTTKIATSD